MCGEHGLGVEDSGEGDGEERDKYLSPLLTVGCMAGTKRVAEGYQRPGHRDV